MRITRDEGVDVIMDAIGPSSFRKDYRILRPGGRLIMYGASELQSGDRRNIGSALRGLARMPTATMPWWKSMAVMNENKGVFGLNMLTWWDDEGLDRMLDPLASGLAGGEFEPVVAEAFPFEGGLNRATEPLMAALEAGDLKPVVAEAFPFDRAPDAHRYIHERRNIGKVVLVP